MNKHFWLFGLTSEKAIKTLFNSSLNDYWAFSPLSEIGSANTDSCNFIFVDGDEVSLSDAIRVTSEIDSGSLETVAIFVIGTNADGRCEELAQQLKLITNSRFSILAKQWRYRGHCYL